MNQSEEAKAIREMLGLSDSADDKRKAWLLMYKLHNAGYRIAVRIPRNAG